MGLTENNTVAPVSCCFLFLKCNCFLKIITFKPSSEMIIVTFQYSKVIVQYVQLDLDKSLCKKLSYKCEEMSMVSDKTKEISRILLILIRINIISSFKVWFSEVDLTFTSQPDSSTNVESNNRCILCYSFKPSQI